MTQDKTHPINQYLTPGELVEELMHMTQQMNLKYQRGVRDIPLTKYRDDPTLINLLPERYVALALLPKVADKTVQKGGIEHEGRLYMHPRLNRMRDMKVQIGYTERDRSYVHVFIGKRHICKAVIEPSRTLAGALVASRTRQIETFNRIDLGAEQLRREQTGLDADKFDIRAARAQRKSRRDPRPALPDQVDASLAERRLADLEDPDTWKR